jgi:hypothetical protein
MASLKNGVWRKREQRLRGENRANVNLLPHQSAQQPHARKAAAWRQWRERGYPGRRKTMKKYQ